MVQYYNIRYSILNFVCILKNKKYELYTKRLKNIFFKKLCLEIAYEPFFLKFLRLCFVCIILFAHFLIRFTFGS